MLTSEELEEIIDKFREELLLANRIGQEELEKFLNKHNVEVNKKEESYSYCDIKNAQILIIGQVNIKSKDIDGICKSLGINPNRLDYIPYEEATNYPFDNLRYSNRYSDIIVGATPHKGGGIGNNSSIIGFLESNPLEFPNVIKAYNSSGELDLNKTSLKSTLIKTNYYKENNY